MIDLHTHSTISDGALTPAELVGQAAKNGVTVLALTDHDTVAGLAEAKEAAVQNGIRLIPGIELNIEWHSGEFHLLGLSLKSYTNELYSIIDYLQSERKRRNREILQKMAHGGYQVSYEALEMSAAGGAGSGGRIGLIGRPHIAKYMVDNKIVRSTQEAFDRFLARDRPFYDEIAGVPLEKAVAAIRESGGYPVVAHPLSLYVAWGKMDSLFDDLVKKGVLGIEAWHPAARVVDCERLETLALKKGLFVTAGSDFHGENVRNGRTIGHTAGDIPIADRFLDGITALDA